jgi:hypothetical protein
MRFQSHSDTRIWADPGFCCISHHEGAASGSFKTIELNSGISFRHSRVKPRNAMAFSPESSHGRFFTRIDTAPGWKSGRKQKTKKLPITIFGPDEPCKSKFPQELAPPSWRRDM